MNSSPRIKQLVFATLAVLFVQAASSLSAVAQSSGVRFQRPGSGDQQSERVKSQFRRPSAKTAVREPSVEVAAKPLPKPQFVTDKKATTAKPADTKRRAVKPATNKAAPIKQVVKSARAPRPASVTIQDAPPAQVVQRVRRTSNSNRGSKLYQPRMEAALELSSYGCDVCDGPCTCDASCGCPEPSCGIYEPGCGICEPSCGCGEPSCGICEPSCGVYEPGCGIAEPSCGCGEVDCGSCCGLPGPDYFCFPVCLPRFKDLSVWAGVQSWGGPSSFLENGFGFNQGISLSGRAPLVGLMFPQISYQIGYQAVQSRLEGNVAAFGPPGAVSTDRSQQFVTAGLFRRVSTGVQFGVVWDFLEDDDLGSNIVGPPGANVNLQQMRTEISLKSPQGREFGFMSSISTDQVAPAAAGGIVFEGVDQYALFYRWHFTNGYESRLWGGATNDGDGIFGGDFTAPFNDRWALQAGFNYLSPEDLPTANMIGIDAEESWNVGINIVWHLGKTAKRGGRSPHRPLFRVADNGSFMIDAE